MALAKGPLDAAITHAEEMMKQDLPLYDLDDTTSHEADPQRECIPRSEVVALSATRVFMIAEKLWMP